MYNKRPSACTGHTLDQLTTHVVCSARRGCWRGAWPAARCRPLWCPPRPLVIHQEREIAQKIYKR